MVLRLVGDQVRRGVSGFCCGSVGQGRVCKRMGMLHGVPATGEEEGGKTNWSGAARCFPWLIFGEVTDSEHTASEEG